MQESKVVVPRPRKNGDTLVACHVDQYEDLLKEKVAKLNGMLQNALGQPDSQIPNIEVFSSPKTHFRMRLVKILRLLYFFL